MKKKVIYLDYNSTSPCIDWYDSMKEIMLFPLNPSSIHYFGRFAKGVLENARREILQTLGLNIREYSLVFTSSGTEANNIAVNSCSNAYALATDHASTLRCIEDTSRIIPVTCKGIVDLDLLKILLKGRGDKPLVCVSLANSETGVVQPIRDIVSVAKSHDALVHVDCVQCVGKLNVQFSDLDCDSMSISSHKIGGMAGIGALIFRKNFSIKTYTKGGGQEFGIRSGTESVLHAAIFSQALSKAVNNVRNYMQHVSKLRDIMENLISQVCENVKFWCQDMERLPNTSCIMMPYVDAKIQVMRFDMLGFAVSMGSACSSGSMTYSHVLKAMQLSEDEIRSSIRVSLGYDTTEEHIVEFVKAWEVVYNQRG
ncbi:cysteine desulfurase family protein [Candidatus Sneabacter namystus]|uniref:Cysteine desulfurase n=1 Tax=Candidatus Sneabacter namystus TaxID=2601646 RepID=A0A5C0UL32_9RICK|nr:cysteine desulfurase family protein [Candidatus Sneabacter namystus]QEK39564.1 cysteine desulfurase [Candidatus Sneabacter namystus]